MMIASNDKMNQDGLPYMGYFSRSVTFLSDTLICVIVFVIMDNTIICSVNCE